MSNLLAYLASCSTDIPCPENFQNMPDSVKSNAVAIALVNQGELQAVGVTLAKVLSGETPADEVIQFVRELQLAGKAFFIPKPHLNGKLMPADQKVQTKKYGNSAVQKTTGDVMNKFEFDYELFFSTQTVMFFNWLRENLKDYDVVVWTDSTVSIIADEDLAWDIPGYEFTGNGDDNVDGKFGFSYLGKGQPIPIRGIDPKRLIGFTSLTITNPAISSAFVVKSTCGSDCNVFVGAVGGTLSGTLNFDVTGQSSCLKWSLYLDCIEGALSSAATPLKIDENTGIVTVATFPANSVAKYKVVAVSDACVVGEYCFKIVSLPTP